MNTQTLTVDGIMVDHSILLEAGVAVVFDFLDKPTTTPVNSHNGIDVLYYDNLFIFAFDTEEKREEYKKSYAGLTSSQNWFIPRIGNFFERNGKYYFVGDYDDKRLADISDTTKNNNILYRGVVINPVIYGELSNVKTKTDGRLLNKDTYEK